MEIYVQSCGMAQNKGYRWIKESQQIVETPDSIQEVEELIESEANSIVLARKQNKLLLLVTGLESSRKDYRGRRILNSVAWITEDSSGEEEKLRAIAVNALQGKLQGSIDKAITNTVGKSTKKSSKNESNLSVNQNEDYGFEVDFNKIKIDDLNVESVKSGSPNKKNDVKSYSNLEESKIPLIEELQKSKLPDGDRPLVVVTGIKLDSALRDANVWRGLTKNLTNMQGSNNHNTNQAGKQQFNRIIPGILAVLLIISLAANGYSYWQYNKVGGWKETIQNLTDQKGNLDKDIKNLTDKRDELLDKVNNLTELESVIEEEIDKVDQIKQLLENAGKRIHTKILKYKNEFIKVKVN